jgi:RNA recognition motif-containing protein
VGQNKTSFYKKLQLTHHFQFYQVKIEGINSSKLDIGSKKMSTTRVYIGRLSSRASERDVEHFFRGYGRIRDIVLKNGFGFVVSLFQFIPKA